MAELFLLGFDDADRFFVDEQHIVCRPDVGLVFANGDAEAGAEIDFLGRLDDPTRVFELRIDGVAGLLFRVLIFAHRVLRFVDKDNRRMIREVAKGVAMPKT